VHHLCDSTDSQPARFDAYDADDSGFIDFAELEAATASWAALELQREANELATQESPTARGRRLQAAKEHALVQQANEEHEVALLLAWESQGAQSHARPLSSPHDLTALARAVMRQGDQMQGNDQLSPAEVDTFLRGSRFDAFAGWLLGRVWGERMQRFHRFVQGNGGCIGLEGLGIALAEYLGSTTTQATAAEGTIQGAAGEAAQTAAAEEAAMMAAEEAAGSQGAENTVHEGTAEAAMMAAEEAAKMAGVEGAVMRAAEGAVHGAAEKVPQQSSSTTHITGSVLVDSAAAASSDVMSMVSDPKGAALLRRGCRRPALLQ